MKIIIAFLLFALSLPAMALSIQSDKFATSSTIAAPGSVSTKWYDVRHMHYVDFTIVATAGDGTLEVEYASDILGNGVIADPAVGAFDSTQTATLSAAGVGKFYIRLNVTCVTAPCTYSGWFASKGMM